MGSVHNFENSVPVFGTVYGVALFAGEPVGGPSVRQDAPSASVFFIKPRNTFLHGGGTVRLPATLSTVEVAATLGISFMRDVRSVSAAEAFNYVAGYTLAIDVSEPGEDFFRPPIRGKCRDGFLPIGPSIVAHGSIEDVGMLDVRLEIDGSPVGSFNLQDRLPAIAKLIAEMSAFMTLRAHDLLLVARTPPGVVAGIGSRISVISDQLGQLECTLNREEEGA